MELLSGVVCSFLVVRSVLTGGGALLLGFDRRLAHELGFPVRVARHPRHSVVRGAAAFLETF